MLPLLCRACLCQLTDQNDIVPLFEKFHDVLYYRICNAIQLSVEDDNIGGNICKRCAESIMNFYSFRLMFLESDKTLRKMICDADIGIKKRKTNDYNIPDVGSIVQTSMGLADSKWKCKKCLAGFKARSLLREHSRQVHRQLTIGNNLKTSKKNTTKVKHNEMKRWKCTNCSKRFGTKQRKAIHQKNCSMNAQPGDVGVIDGSDLSNDNDSIESHFDNNIIDSQIHQREFKYEDQSKFDTFDDMDGKSANDLMLIANPLKLRNIDEMTDVTSTTSEEWKCKKCAKCFETRKLLCEHHNIQHQESVMEEFLLQNIKQEHLDIEDYQVKTEHDRPEVGFTFAEVKVYNDTNLRWKCTTCLLAFPSRELLRIHRRSHPDYRKSSSIRNTNPSDHKEWRCSICQDIFPSYHKIRKHRRLEHPREQKLRMSNNNFKNWGENIDETEYLCELCNKIFATKSKIRKHMDTHKNKGRPKRLCTICGIELCSTYNLNNHMRVVHGGERKFQCTLCSRRYSHSHHLKSHMNRHKNIRPFNCDLCPKSFFDKTTLREHVKSVHLNLKQYSCKICLKAFNRSGNMRAHMLKTHHLGEPESRVAFVVEPDSRIQLQHFMIQESRTVSHQEK